nr:zinc finger, CCHC-type [Tanacetum cinerariifolium]
MHSMGKTIARLHAMLKLPEKGLPKKTETSIVLAIRGGKIQKDKKKPQGAKGKDKGKTNLAYAPNSMISWPPKRENLAKDSICHHCEEVDHYRRNNPAYHIKLKKKKVTSVASTSVGSPFFWQWEHPPLAVGTYTASRNSLLAVGMPCAFYSQHQPRRLKAPYDIWHGKAPKLSYLRVWGWRVWGVVLLIGFGDEGWPPRPKPAPFPFLNEVEHIEVEPHSEKVSTCRSKRIS